MKRLPTFGTVIYYEIRELDPENPIWLTDWPCEIVERDDFNSWENTVRSNIDIDPDVDIKTLFDINKYMMQNCMYMSKYVIGRPYDDDFSKIIDRDCERCGHLLVEQHDEGIFCSNRDCDYMDEAMIEYQKQWEIDRNKPPSPKFREPGQTLEQFIEKYAFRNIDTKDRSCTVCNQKTDVSDFFVQGGYATIRFGAGHLDNCTNKGCPCVAIPIGKKKDEWRELIGGL